MFTPARFRIRSQMLVAMITILVAMTATSLLVLRTSMRREVRRQTAEALAAAVRAFQRVEQQQGSELLRTAAILSELPTLKALMTTEDAATIQDASAEFWDLSGSDAMVLATSSGRLMAVHASSPGLTPQAAARLLAAGRARFERPGWWLDGGELFRVVARPIISGSGEHKQLLGTLVIAARMNSAVAQQIGHFSATEIALASGDTVVASTFSQPGSVELARWLRSGPATDKTRPQEIAIGGRYFEVAAIDLETGPTTPLRCYMLLPLDATLAFLSRLNRTNLMLGLAAIVLGTAWVMWISGALTRPLEKLVAAARAFGAGDPTSPLDSRGSAEVMQLAGAFSSMRSQLLESQRKQIEAERLAALGRAAASISHDLRHHLAALVANAEFLHDAEELGFDAEEVYREIQHASAHMTELIESLLEFGHERRTLAVGEADLEEVVRRAADEVRLQPEYRGRPIEIAADAPACGTFDAAKLERAFLNLLLNACEAACDNHGRVGVRINPTGQVFECRVWDTGRGIPSAIRDTLFDPFVSAGKNNGTGLGLAIASKIVHDHDGEIMVERTSAEGTTLLVRIPRYAADHPPGTANLSASTGATSP